MLRYPRTPKPTDAAVLVLGLSALATAAAHSKSSSIVNGETITVGGSLDIEPAHETQSIVGPHRL